MNGIIKYFFFTVLPFSLSTALLVFTKVVHPLVKYFRMHSIKNAGFLEDVLTA